MQAKFIEELLNERNVRSLELYLVDGNKIDVEEIDKKFLKVPTLEVLSPARYIVNLEHVTNIKVNHEGESEGRLEIMNNTKF